VLAGAIPAALLALVADAGLGLVEKKMTVRRVWRRRRKMGDLPGILVCWGWFFVWQGWFVGWFFVVC
jgi:hypothetical protein